MTRTILLSVLLIVTLAVLSCSEAEKAPSGSGMIEATEVVVSAEAAGRLERLYFDEGDNINRGDTIALIDTVMTALKLRQAEAVRQTLTAQRQNARIRVQQAELSDALAQKEYERVSRLLSSGSANQQEFDRVKNAADQAGLGLKAARVAVDAADADLARVDAEMAILTQQYRDCLPLMPAGGMVVTKYVEEGELVGIGKPLLKVAKLDSVWVKIYLPPQDLTRFTLGDSAEVDPEDGRAAPVRGVVTWISEEAEFTPKNVQTRQARADLVYAVKITIPNPKQELKIGMPVSVRIP